MGLRRRRLLGFGVAVGASVTSAACLGRGERGHPPTEGQPDGGSKTEALVAGSLLKLASAVPGGTVEAHGSLAVRQLVRDGLRDPDAVALADPALFAGIAEEATVFATNALVVAYDPASPLADALRTDWAEALTREGVTWGRTDPATDPLGYRTLLALRLAARDGRLDPDALLANSTVLPETGLARAVHTADVDAAVTYRNMADEQGLPSVDLPAAIDFSDPSLAERYRSVSVTVDDETYTSGPIRYGAAGLTEAGREWVKRLVGGSKRLRDHGFGVPEGYPNRVRIAEE